MSILGQDEILQLRSAVISAGLSESRCALLSGIDSRFVANLSVAAAPGEQVLRDLDALNTAGALTDGTVPLHIWLKNATALSESRQEAQVFQMALVQCASYPISVSGLPLVIARASQIFMNGDKRGRLQAEQMVEQGTASIPYSWLLDVTVRNHSKYERAMIAKAIAVHPSRDAAGLIVLLTLLASAPAEGGVYSYRILTSVRRLLLEGIGETSPSGSETLIRRCLIALEMLEAGSGADTPKAAHDVRMLLFKFGVPRQADGQG